MTTLDLDGALERTRHMHGADSLRITLLLSDPAVAQAFYARVAAAMGAHGLGLSDAGEVEPAAAPPSVPRLMAVVADEAGRARVLFGIGEVVDKAERVALLVRAVYDSGQALDDRLALVRAHAGAENAS